MSILLEQLDGLESEEMEKGIVAAMSPYIRESDRRDILRRLDRRRPTPKADRREIQVVAHDPKKAREWFESINARVA